MFLRNPTMFFAPDAGAGAGDTAAAVADKGAGAADKGSAADAGKGAGDGKGAADAGKAGAAADAGKGGEGKAGDATLLGAADGKDGDGKGDGKQVVPATWPEDWATKMAKGDEKKLGLLKRYSSPETMAEAFLAQRQKISSGELRTALADDATETQVAAWRKDNGIPEKPEGYLEKLPDGIVIGEDDKKLVTDFATAMHKVNAPPAVVAQAIDWHYKFEEAIKADQAEADKAFHTENDDSLRSEFGPEYRGNINTIKSFLGDLPDGLADDLLGARLANGHKLGNDARVVRWLLEVAKEIKPAATVTGASGAQAGKAMADEIAEIEGKMADGHSDYWRGPKAQGLQDRYLQLITARDKAKARAA